MRPLVCTYLESNSFFDLKSEYGVNVRPSADFSKYSLNYDQIESKWGVLLSDQCRGLIVRPTVSLVSDQYLTRVVGEVELVAWPMHRFYNYGDPLAERIDWNDMNLRIPEKLDGTMCELYFDRLQSRWCVATRSVPEADCAFRCGDIVSGDMTFAELFWIGMKNTMKLTMPDIDLLVHTNVLPIHMDRNFTYVYELTSQLNRVVVKYDETLITLIAVRDLRTGKEIDPSTLTPSQGGVRHPTYMKFDSTDDIVSFVCKSDPMKLEGVVPVDSEFRRVKIKNPAWVLSSKLREDMNMTKRRTLTAIIDGTIDDLLASVDDDLRKKIEELRESMLSYVRKNDEKYDVMYQSLTDKISRKEFALLVCADRSCMKGAMFDRYTGRVKNTLEWVRKNVGGSIVDFLLERM